MQNNQEEIFIDVDKISQELRIRPQIYTKLLKSFALNLTGKLSLLNQAMTTNDRDQMRMILHEIKGTAGNLRLSSISAPEAILHIAVKAGESQRVLATHLEALRQAVEKLQQYVARLPDAPPTNPT